MDIKEKILSLMRIKGPIIPVQIAKAIESNILIASAHLAELSKQGKIKISNLKHGGTPLYYLQGQEQLLQKFTDNLHEKAKKAYELLKEKKILEDSKLDPVLRVALREIKDFAVPIHVTIDNKKILFWKWYLLSKEETQNILGSLFKGEKELKIKKPEIQKQIIIEKDKIKSPVIQEQLQKKSKEEKVEKIQEKPKPKKTISTSADNYFDEVKNYFLKNNIEIINSEVIRKNTEIDFIIKIPSGIGTLEFYCKAKSKKRISDSDLSSAFVQGQLKKLPILFITKGELTKKAKEMHSKEFKNITINKI